jgi:hypothetical protein
LAVTTQIRTATQPQVNHRKEPRNAVA